MPIAAIVLPTIAMMILGVMDMARMSGSKGGLQDALDSAILAAARIPGIDDAERTAIANQYLQTNLNANLRNVTVTITTSGTNKKVMSGTASADVPMIAGPMLGFETAKINAYAEVEAAVESRLELALVLDTTGSMQGAKMQTLKTAARDLVESIMDEDLVKVSVVPFAEYVNVGKTHRNHPGIDVPPDEPGKRKCETRDRNERYNCRTVPSTCWNDGVSRPCTRQVCDTRKIGEREHCWMDGRKIWNGCVGSREAPRNTDLRFHTSEVPGLMNQWCNNPLTRLTEKSATVTSAINGLSTGANTYVPTGLIWGWRTLSPGYPFPDGATPTNDPSKPKVMKAIVLMTDGANTKSKRNNSGWHSGNKRADADRVLTDLCANVKADDIDLYTIAFEVTDAGTKALLTGCASSADHAYDADDAGSLKLAFAEIAQKLTVLKLSR